jgi:hypothetical protein
MATTQIPIAIGAHTRLVLGASVVELSRPNSTADVLVFTVEDQAIRFLVAETTGTLDVDPTTTVGTLVNAGGEGVAYVGEGQVVRFLEQASGAVIQYQWCKMEDAGR